MTETQEMYKVGDTTDLSSIVIAMRSTQLHHPETEHIMLHPETEHIMLHMQVPQIGGHARVQYIVHRAGITESGNRMLWADGYYDSFEDAFNDYIGRA